jgi:hypothetical protein
MHEPHILPSYHRLATRPSAGAAIRDGAIPDFDISRLLV